MSVLSDAAAAGAVVAIVLWVFGHNRGRLALAMLTACAIVLLPIVATDFPQDQLRRYRGDVFNLALLLGLAGGNPGELLAVSSPHLARIAWLGGGVALVSAGILWALVRSGVFSGGVIVPPVSLRRSLGVSGMACLVGILITGGFRINSESFEFGLRHKPTSQMFAAVIARATDLDGDGFALLAHPRDPNLLDARVHPYAFDVPGNGIDEDGIAGDLPPGDSYVEACHRRGPVAQQTERRGLFCSRAFEQMRCPRRRRSGGHARAGQARRAWHFGAARLLAQR